MRFFLILLLLPILAQAQDVRVYRLLSEKDSVAIKDAYIRVDGKAVAISDAFGEFKIMTEAFKKLSITHLNYIEKNISYQDLKEVKDIVLQGKNETLEEITLTHKKRKIKRVLPHQSTWSRLAVMKGHKANFDAMYATYLPNKSPNMDAIIKTILIETHIGIWGDPNKQYMPFLVNLYSVDTLTQLPKDKLLFDTYLVAKKDENQKYVEVDIKEHRIEFPKEGIFVTVETLSEEEYMNFLSISHEAPAFKVIYKHKNSSSITYNRWLNPDGSIKKNWIGKPHEQLTFIYNFGVEIEILN